MSRRSKSDAASSPVPTTTADRAVGRAGGRPGSGPDDHSHLPHHDLDIVLTPEMHRMEVSGTVALPPETTSRDTLGFLLREDLGQPRIEVLEPRSCVGELQLQATGRDPKLGATQRWEGRLPAPCPPDTSLVLSVAYAGGSESNGRWLHLGSEGSFSSWYVSVWLPTFGYRRGTGTLRYLVPKATVVKATGRLISREEHDGRALYTFAADVPSVFDFAAGPYTVVQRREGRIPVSLYLLHPLPRAEEFLTSTADTIAVLEEEFGPYPFDEVSIVEAPTEPGKIAGFEALANQGFLLARSDFLRANSHEVWWLGHELTHFWFPFVVGQAEGTGGSFMLDEALAHYGALRSVEALSGGAAAERFRRDGGQEAIRLTAAGYDNLLAAPSTTEGWDRVGYQLSDAKGHLVYDMLARTIGRDRFQSALHRITREHAATDIAWEDFLNSIEADADQPLQWFYEQWLNRPGVPTLSLVWSQAKARLNCVVTQSGGPLFRLDMPLQIEFSDGTARVHELHIEGETSELDIPTDTPVHAVRLDPHYTTLHATPEQWAEAEARRFLTKGRVAWDDEDLDSALALFREGLDHLPEIDSYGIEFLLRLHIGWLHQESGRFDEAMAEYELALTEPVRPADYLARLYLNLATIAGERGDRERVVWAAQNVLKAERALGKETDRSRQAQQLLSP